jgi:hypothetical protein
MKPIMILAVLVAVCGAALGQGARLAPPPQPSTERVPIRPVTERMGNGDPVAPSNVTGTILAVDNNRRLMMIERADKTKMTLNVDPKVKAKAEKETALAGRKDLSLSDYKKGQLVSIRYRAEDSTAVEIKLKRPKTD